MGGGWPLFGKGVVSPRHQDPPCWWQPNRPHGETPAHERDADATTSPGHGGPRRRRSSAGRCPRAVVAARLGGGRAERAGRGRGGRSGRQRGRRHRWEAAGVGGARHRLRSGAGHGGRRGVGGSRGGRRGRGVPQRRSAGRRRRGRRGGGVPVFVGGARQSHRGADGVGRAARASAVVRLADLRGRAARRGPPARRRGGQAQRVLGLGHARAAGPPRSARRHRGRAGRAGARPGGPV